MIIVSQNRDAIFNFRNIGYIEIVADDKTLRCQILDENVFLGTYATRERAKEILQEMVNAYKGYADNYEMPEK